MSYRQDTESLIRLLDAIAARAYLSEGVVLKEGCPPQVKCEFTDAERRAIRLYLALYIGVLREIRYPQPSFFAYVPSPPLLQMLSYMVSTGDAIPPEYVAENTQRLADALDSHRELFESHAFAREMENLA